MSTMLTPKNKITVVRRKTPSPVQKPHGTNASSALAPTAPALFMVGIGTSAGGFEALRLLIENLKPNHQTAYIVAQQLALQQAIVLTTLLAHNANIPVICANDDQQVEADHIYVVPPHCDVYIKN